MRRDGTPTFWPNHLKTYKDCPQHYYLKFVRKRAGRLVDISAMKRGQVTHNVLAVAFNYFRARQSFPDGLDKRITERLPVDDYPSRITGNRMCASLATGLRTPSKRSTRASRSSLLRRRIGFRSMAALPNPPSC